MAEIELSVLSTQCLDRRIPDKAKLTEGVAAWEAERNAKHAKADWQFTTADARVKLNGAIRQYERLGALCDQLDYQREAGVASRLPGFD
jgi:hypothetical protein